jgi:hypothetical protein
MASGIQQSIGTVVPIELGRKLERSYHGAISSK